MGKPIRHRAACGTARSAAFCGDMRVLTIERTDGVTTLRFAGRLDADGAGKVWSEAMAVASGRVVIDAGELTYCDGAGVALIHALVQRKGAEVRTVTPDAKRLIDQFSDLPEVSPPVRARRNPLVEVGLVVAALGRDLRDQITFLGEALVMLLRVMRHPRSLRWGDMWSTFDQAGTCALGIVGMISFLVGLIMAFQSSVPLRQFGVDIFVVNLVALAMLRELGPIMTAIVLAGRSGSAFAAEIGTMKVNEEVDALRTMGLDPVGFLVAPRLIAGILVTPLLTVFANLLGVAGGLVVMLSLGYPFAALWQQLVGAVTIDDLLAGLIKAFVFGALVAGIGCLRGLQTKAGASAVGVSTTRAVVSGIFLIVVVDAIFAVVFYAIGF